ncbi:DNA polymerase III subunit gamma and tau, partial [Tsukamurella conjunctivitidis]
MALYRKYRPATFAEVVGQEHVTEPLSTALDSGRVNHAYLFSGPRGCGKTSSARILARSLNCEQGPTSTPCGVCNSCVALAPGGPGNLDVTEMDAASHGGVDDARELRDRAFYAPAESRYRVFIVDEAHMVTPQGFNALLKIVEEPPEHLIFIFATTEPEKVLTTIRSRTHHYPFRLLAPNVMRPLLEKITGAEQVTVEPQVYPLVIRAGGGSPRDSLSIMDQLLAGAGPEGVTYQRALGLLGVTDTALIDAAVDALAEGDGAALFGAVEKVMEAGHDPRRFATDLLERLRDLILLHTVPDAADRGLIDVPQDVLETMRGEAAKLGLATLTRCAEVTHASLAEMRGATSPRLLLEVMCARMLLPAAEDSQAALLQRIETLERRPAGAPVDGAAPASAPAAGTGGQAVPAPSSDGPPARFVRPSQRQAEAAPEPRPASTPQPTTPQPATPQPATPQPATPQPATPQPAAAAPAAEPAPPSAPP